VETKFTWHGRKHDEQEAQKSHMGRVTHAHPTYVSPADAWFDEKLGKDAWRQPIHNPLTYTEKANIYNAKSAIKVGVY